MKIVFWTIKLSLLLKFVLWLFSNEIQQFAAFLPRVRVSGDPETLVGVAVFGVCLIFFLSCGVYAWREEAKYKREKKREREMEIKRMHERAFTLSNY
jgi:hypothetical protein